jgi:hypothetical protein
MIDMHSKRPILYETLQNPAEDEGDYANVDGQFCVAFAGPVLRQD